jgi:hypothetical protein
MRSRSTKTNYKSCDDILTYRTTTTVQQLASWELNGELYPIPDTQRRQSSIVREV